MQSILLLFIAGSMSSNTIQLLLCQILFYILDAIYMLYRFFAQVSVSKLIPFAVPIKNAVMLMTSITSCMLSCNFVQYVVWLPACKSHSSHKSIGSFQIPVPYPCRVNTMTAFTACSKTKEALGRLLSRYTE